MIKFLKEAGYTVKDPERTFGNAGIDFFIPEATPEFYAAFEAKNTRDNAQLWHNDKGEHFINILPHGRVNIPSGFRSYISDNIALEAQNKSGIATKYGLVYGASTVDASYEGIIHLSLINTTGKSIDLPLGTKIIQFIPRLIDVSEIEVDHISSVEDFYADFKFSNRGEGAFGSTGTK